jgi:hypothetical protein
MSAPFIFFNFRSSNPWIQIGSGSGYGTYQDSLEMLNPDLYPDPDPQLCLKGEQHKKFFISIVVPVHN